QMLVDSGVMSREEAAKSRSRHILVNALGGSNDVHVDVERVPLANGDRVLLCTDGLTDGVDDDAIRTLLAEGATAAAASESLIARALDGGGRDNVTVVVGIYSWHEGD